MPLQQFRLLLMTKRRFPDSPAICKYLGGNEITAAVWGTMAIAPGHSLHLGFDASASPTFHVRLDGELFRGVTPRDGVVCRESSRIASRNAV